MGGGFSGCEVWVYLLAAVGWLCVCVCGIDRRAYVSSSPMPTGLQAPTVSVKSTFKQCPGSQGSNLSRAPSRSFDTNLRNPSQIVGLESAGVCWAVCVAGLGQGAQKGSIWEV